MTYPFYIITSYAAVFGVLFLFWLSQWKKWRSFLKNSQYE